MNFFTNILFRARQPRGVPGPEPLVDPTPPGKVLSEPERRIEEALASQAVTLDLEGLGLTEWPESLHKLETQLVWLRLSKNRLTSVPESIGRFKSLESLYLTGTGLTSLPDSLGGLPELKTLDLSGNGLNSLPGWLTRLTRLETLRLGGNGLMSLPDCLGKLRQLRSLDLRGVGLTSLPEWLGELTRLEWLDVASNGLSLLPESLGRLTHLKNLYISWNPLGSLPDWLGGLRQLEELSLSGCNLRSFPEWLGGFAQLRSLDFACNQETSLPEWLGGLAQLQWLNVNNNGLTSLPEWLGCLSGLESLHLAGNRLTSIPESLTRLPLKQLFLHDNDGLGIPKEILGPTYSEVLEKKTPASPSAILGYYFRLRAGKRPLNEVKLILLGRGGVGKTSLVRGLDGKEFDPNSAKTEGIKITPWPVVVGGETVRLHVWDFGGQEIMHATHQFFLSERSVYLVVLSGREGSQDADAEYWLRLVESFGGESPVFVVLNKIREHPADVNRRALRQKYPNIRGFLETDCQDRSGLNELGEAVRDTLASWKAWRVDFPSSWFAIKERLAGMTESYLSFTAYREICRGLDEGDDASQEELAGHLHKLGVALNYKDDPRLRDTHVLNPHWVTGGIYRVLNSPRLETRKGVLHADDLAHTLPADEYPREMHLFVLDLMRKFELCFPFPDDAGGYLVPELLPKQQPEEADGFAEGECLGFEYRYPILPEGLIPRFIVRSHTMSEGQPRWRSGVILRFEGCRALVKGDVAEKTVTVRVSGPVVGRRRLLAVIRSDFERIHASIRDLKPEECVPVPGRPGCWVRYHKLWTLEKKGTRSFVEVFGDDDVVELNVAELLDGVDLPGVRRRSEGERSKAEAPLRVFFSYARKDQGLRDELGNHLKILERLGLISLWYDRMITAGEDWAGVIDEKLESADIVLLLVSSDFMASNYCYEREMGRALERDRAGEAVVIPVIVRDVAWNDAPFARLNALPEGGRAVTLWPDRDSAWRSVSEGIKRVAGDRRPPR